MERTMGGRMEMLDQTSAARLPARSHAARLESHYYQVKRATAAPAHSTHQMPARYAKANTTKPQRQSGPRKKRK
jgi:hypothetical protein